MLAFGKCGGYNCYHIFACRNLAIIRDYSTLLKDEVILLPTANDLSSGFAYYLCDVAVPEIEKFHDMPPTSDALVSLLDPFVHGLIHTRNKILLKKLYGDVFVPIVENIKAKSGVFTHLDGKTMAEQLFDIGAFDFFPRRSPVRFRKILSAFEVIHIFGNL